MAKIIDIKTRQTLFDSPSKPTAKRVKVWKYLDANPMRHKLYTLAASETEANRNISRAEIVIYKRKVS